jgi:hypothetical protein
VTPVFTTSLSLCFSLNAIDAIKRVVRKRGDVEVASRTGPEIGAKSNAVPCCTTQSSVGIA